MTDEMKKQIAIYLDKKTIDKLESTSTKFRRKLSVLASEIVTDYVKHADFEKTITLKEKNRLKKRLKDLENL